MKKSNIYTFEEICVGEEIGREREREEKHDCDLTPKKIQTRIIESPASRRRICRKESVLFFIESREILECKSRHHRTGRRSGSLSIDHIDLLLGYRCTRKKLKWKLQRDVLVDEHQCILDSGKG